MEDELAALYLNGGEDDEWRFDFGKGVGDGGVDLCFVTNR